MKKKIPTVLTILRALAAIPLFFTIPSYPLAALCLFSLAALSDAVDGRLARRWDAQTRLGAILDPYADKILYLSTLFYLRHAAPAIPWIFFVTAPIEVALALIRIYTISLWLSIHSIQANEFGKMKMWVQSSATMCMLLGLTLNDHDVVMLGAGMAVGAIFLSWKSLVSHLR